MDSRPYFCRHCKAPLGLSSETILTIGRAQFRQFVTFTCGRCAGLVKWVPVKKENTTEKTVLVSTAA